MPLSWNDSDAWQLENRSLDGFASPYVGNGALGTRLGIFVLGADPRAPEFHGATGLPQRPDIPPGDPHRSLATFSSFVRDGFQYALPSWNQLDLTLAGVPFHPVRGGHDFRQTLDLRTGEAAFSDDWTYAPNRRARIVIRLLIPRTHPHGSLWELHVAADHDDPIEARFGLRAAHLAGQLPMRYRAAGAGLIVGEGRTARRKRPVAQGLAWQTDGSEVAVQIDKHDAAVHVAGQLRDGGGRLALTVFHALHGGLEDPANAQANVRRTLAELAAAHAADLRERNLALWKPLWAAALRCDDLDPQDARLVLAQQFYLLASLELSEYPFGPLGVSGNNWQGNALWDADRWIGGAVLGLWPEYARRFPAFRAALLPAARRFARSRGYDGAWFPWIHDEEGENTTSEHYLPETHNNLWIAHTAWQLWLETRDEAFLKEQAWPLIRDIAAFYVSRCERDADGTWHQRRVLGPDEAVAEVHHTTCDDNVLVNVGTRWLMRTAIAAAKLLRQSPDPKWRVLAENLVVLPPRADKVIPEHAAYTDQGIKQADTILAFFPLDHDAPPDVVRATLEHYRGKILDYGPLMTSQIEAAILMRLGDRDEGLRRLFARYREYVRGPFLVPFECRNNDTAVMLTGIGGLLQALLCGWHNWRPGGDVRLPRIGDEWGE